MPFTRQEVKAMSNEELNLNLRWANAIVNYGQTVYGESLLDDYEQDLEHIKDELFARKYQKYSAR